MGWGMGRSQQRPETRPIWAMFLLYKQRPSRHQKRIRADAFSVSARWGMANKKQKHTHGGMFLVVEWRRACGHQKHVQVLHEGNGRGGEGASQECLQTPKTRPRRRVFGVRRRGEVGLRGWCGGWVWWGLGVMPATKNATRVVFFVYSGYSWQVGMGVLGMEREGSRLVREGGCRRCHRRFRRVGDVMERQGESKSPCRVKTREGGLLWA